MTLRSYVDSEDKFNNSHFRTPSPTKPLAASGKKNKSFGALPDYVKPVMKTKITPSLLEYYGTREDIWNADATKSNEFLDLLQDILNRIFPHKKIALKKGDVVYKYVCICYLIHLAYDYN